MGASDEIRSRMASEKMPFKSVYDPDADDGQGITAYPPEPSALVSTKSAVISL